LIFEESYEREDSYLLYRTITLMTYYTMDSPKARANYSVRKYSIRKQVKNKTLKLTAIKRNLKWVQKKVYKTLFSDQ
jgi:hypothetical protein